jgi:cytochrome c-type protein NapB
MPRREVTLEHAVGRSAVDRAPNYAELREIRRGPNARMYEGTLAVLAATKPALTDPVVQSEEDYRRAIEARRARRAYDGAPPTVPHAIEPLNTSACLACHGKDVAIAGKRASRLPHPPHPDCLQCHVPQTGTPANGLPENHFAGLSSPGPGARAWPGAPPVIPHSTWMRGECGSCHGVGGSSGLRSTHPWRSSCQQCHVPSAVLDQRAP